MKSHIKKGSLNIIALLVTTTVLLIALTGCTSSAAAPLPPQQRVRVATTTSLYDTGLWGYLEPRFEDKYDVELDVLYAGTGIALEYGKRGDVDVITVHSKIREKQFVAEGYGVKRVPFAYNYFLIVGPASDPAGIKGLSPEEAFKKLVETGSSSFISRGDDSGTHSKEKAIWKAAGYDYEAVRTEQWYIEAGRGMGPTLLMASEKEAYTLSDMGTFLTYKGQTGLVPVVDEGDLLLNVYSVIAVNPEKNPDVNYEMAENMVNFLTSPKILELIGNYGTREYGMPLFKPITGAEPQSYNILGRSDALTELWQGLVKAVQLIVTLDSEVMEVAGRSLMISVTSTFLASLVSLPLASLIHFRIFPGRRTLINLIQTLFSMPTVVIGLFVFVLFSRAGPLGGLNLLFTPTVMVLGQMILITPIILGLTISALSGIDRAIPDTARSLGASGLQTAVVVLGEARFAVTAAVIMGFGRAISELGIALMVGGNIKGFTRVITTAISLETTRGDLELSLALGIILIFIALVINIALNRIQQR